MLTLIPEPSNLFVFVEEHPDSFNDGYFLNRPAQREWSDLQASYHDGGANLTFADFEWLMERTTLRRAGASSGPYRAD